MNGMLQINEILERLWNLALDFLPRVVGAFLILFTGWLLGRLVGFGVKKASMKLKLDKGLARIMLGKIIVRAGMGISEFLDHLTRWLFYIFAIITAIDLLGIKALQTLSSMAIVYMPSLIGGLFVFILGFIVVDFVSDVLAETVKGIKIEYAFVLILGLRFLLYIVVAMVSLSMLEIDVSIFYIFVNASAWGIAIGVAVGLGIALGWGLKDIVSKNAERIISATRVTVDQVDKSAEIMEQREKIRRLEEEVAKGNQSISDMKEVRMIILEDLAAPIEDPLTRLKEVIGEKGSVSMSYGGYNVIAKDILNFPWSEVLVILNSLGFDVWLKKEEGQFVIKSKEPSMD